MLRILKYIIIILLVPTLPVSAQEEFIFKINDKPVSKSEFVYYYTRSKISSAESFLPSFIKYQQQLAEAKDLKLDTLSSYKVQLQYCKSLLSKKTDNTLSSNSAKKSTWVKFYNIDKHLPQNSSQQFVKKGMNLMDSLYTLVKNGADINELAQEFSDDYIKGNEESKYEYIKINLLPNEVISKITSASKLDVIPPFLSPSGIHLIKIVDIKDSIVNKSNIVSSSSTLDNYNEKFLENDLLVSLYKNAYENDSTEINDKQLDNYYKNNISDYYYKEPIFKGALIKCASKKMSKVIRKYLKKYNSDEWKGKLYELTKSDEGKHVKIDQGEFKEGDNAYIDKLVFKKKKQIEEDKDLPYCFVIGKKLDKKPDSYKDVIDKLTIDYLNYKEIAQKDALNKKYKVEINEGVLKTVNNSGTN